MFITKKKYEEALNKVKREIEEQCEKRMYEADNRVWEEQEKNRMKEEFLRRFDSLEKRVYTLEKHTGLIGEEFVCPNCIPSSYF